MVKISYTYEKIIRVLEREREREKRRERTERERTKNISRIIISFRNRPRRITTL